MRVILHSEGHSLFIMLMFFSSSLQLLQNPVFSCTLGRRYRLVACEVDGVDVLGMVLGDYFSFL